MSDPTPPGATPPRAVSRKSEGPRREGAQRRNRREHRGQGSQNGTGHGSHPRRPFTPEQVAARAASLPTITYPEELPVSARRAE
ncbi:MAG: hypothetical protein EOL89_06220, partial [Actinobacteria bacterium]|nr:hypothetical protein [Actinomycetota bacterium]